MGISGRRFGIVWKKTRKTLDVAQQTVMPILDFLTFLFGGGFAKHGVEDGAKLALIKLGELAERSVLVILTGDGVDPRLKVDRRRGVAQAGGIKRMERTDPSTSEDEGSAQTVYEIYTLLSIIIADHPHLIPKLLLLLTPTESDTLWPIVLEDFDRLGFPPNAEGGHAAAAHVALPPDSVGEEDLPGLVAIVERLKARELQEGEWAHVLLPTGVFPAVVASDGDLVHLLKPTTITCKSMFVPSWKEQVPSVQLVKAVKVSSAREAFIAGVRAQFGSEATLRHCWLAYVAVQSLYGDCGPFAARAEVEKRVGWDGAFNLAMEGEEQRSIGDRIEAILRVSDCCVSWQEHKNRQRQEGVADKNLLSLERFKELKLYRPNLERLNHLRIQAWKAVARFCGDVAPAHILCALPSRLRPIFEKAMPGTAEAKTHLQSIFDSSKTTTWSLRRTDLFVIPEVMNEVVKHFGVEDPATRSRSWTIDSQPSDAVWQEVLFQSGIYERNESSTIYGPRVIGRSVRCSAALEKLGIAEVDAALGIPPNSTVRRKAQNLFEELYTDALWLARLTSKMRPLWLKDEAAAALEEAEQDEGGDGVGEEEWEMDEEEGGVSGLWGWLQEHGSYPTNELHQAYLTRPLKSWEERQADARLALNISLDGFKGALAFKDKVDTLKGDLTSSLCLGSSGSVSTHYSAHHTALSVAKTIDACAAITSQASLHFSVVDLRNALRSAELDFNPQPVLPAVLYPAFRQAGVQFKPELDLSDVGHQNSRKSRALALLIRTGALALEVFRRHPVRILRVLDPSACGIDSSDLSLTRVAIVIHLAQQHPSATSFDDEAITNSLKTNMVRLEFRDIRSTLKALDLYSETPPEPGQRRRDPRPVPLGTQDTLATVMARILSGNAYIDDEEKQDQVALQHTSTAKQAAAKKLGQAGARAREQSKADQDSPADTGSSSSNRSLRSLRSSRSTSITSRAATTASDEHTSDEDVSSIESPSGSTSTRHSPGPAQRLHSSSSSSRATGSKTSTRGGKLNHKRSASPSSSTGGGVGSGGSAPKKRRGVLGVRKRLPLP